MNWKIFASNTPLFIQGMTGKEGARMAKWLIESGSQVVAGITPGKSGEVAEGRPIFNSVQEAKTQFPQVETSIIVAPASRVVGAVEEAVCAGIRYLNVLAENIPVHDVLRMRAVTASHGVVLLGPSSVGYLQMPDFRLGYIGGENPWRVLLPGDIAVISTSGGMVNEVMMGLARAGIGIRLAFAIGGDRFPVFSLEDAVAFCEQESGIKRLVIFVEPGRPFLTHLLKGMIPLTKSHVLFLAGTVLDILPRGKAYGHTGTLLGEEESSVQEMRRALQEKGYRCVSTLDECIQACK